MKNNEILMDVIGETDEKLIPSLQQKKKNITRWIILGGMCAAAVICGVIMMPKNDADDISVIKDRPGSGTTTQSAGNIPDEVPPATEFVPAETEHIPADKDDTMTYGVSGVTKSVPAGKATVLSKAVYPEMAPYPALAEESTYMSDPVDPFDAWYDSVRSVRNQPEGYDEGFDKFFSASAPIFLADAGNENRVYSPLSLYMALAMTAEVSDGNTRQQLLDALSSRDIDTLRSHARSVWLANFMDDGASKSILANSMWTNRLKSYNPDTVKNVSDNYYASVFSGSPESDEYNEMFRNWINEQTDGLLSDNIQDHRMSPDMVLTLASTVNYSGKWAEAFDKERTAEGTFHAPDGDIQCDFLNGDMLTSFCRGENFAAVSLDIEGNGSVRLILPDDGVTVSELINDSRTMDYMMKRSVYDDSIRACTHISLPAFDVSSETDLIDGMKKMGITDAFDANTADFSPLCDGDIAITKAEQASRVVIDEDGCKAASYTVIEMTEGFEEISPDEISITFDKPFIFEIVSETGMPVFTGIVNTPVNIPTDISE